MKITREFIFEGRSLFGGWSRQQVECLGLRWPLRRGWIARVVGIEISEEAAREFLRLRDAHVDPWAIEERRNVEHLRSIR